MISYDAYISQVTNELIYGTETDSETLKTLWIPEGRGEGGMDWGFGIGICTLRYVEWLANRDLLYKHRELYPMFYDNLHRKRIWKRTDVYTCTTESLFHSRNYHNIVNQLYFSKTFKNEKNKRRPSQLGAPKSVCGWGQTVISREEIRSG